MSFLMFQSQESEEAKVGLDNNLSFNFFFYIISLKVSIWYIWSVFFILQSILKILLHLLINPMELQTIGACDFQLQHV